MVDQPFGAGRVFLFAGDPFFRAWNGSVERQALNALLYPMGALLPRIRFRRRARRPR